MHDFIWKCAIVTGCCLIVCWGIYSIIPKYHFMDDKTKCNTATGLIEYKDGRGHWRSY